MAKRYTSDGDSLYENDRKKPDDSGVRIAFDDMADPKVRFHSIDEFQEECEYRNYCPDKDMGKLHGTDVYGTARVDFLIFSASNDVIMYNSFINGVSCDSVLKPLWDYLTP